MAKEKEPMNTEQRAAIYITAIVAAAICIFTLILSWGLTRNAVTALENGYVEKVVPGRMSTIWAKPEKTGEDTDGEEEGSN